jgi:hypothetical protein
MKGESVIKGVDLRFASYSPESAAVDAPFLVNVTHYVPLVFVLTLFPRTLRK